MRDRSKGDAAVGENVATLRAMAGWSQKDLARRMGVGQSMVSELEHGQHCWTIALMLHAAEALGVPVRVLLPGEPPMLSDGETDLIRTVRRGDEAEVIRMALAVARAGGAR